MTGIYIMRSFSLLLLFSFLLNIPAIGDPGIPDTVRVDSVGAHPSSTAILPVYFYNDEALAGIQIVLKYDSAYLGLDSVSVHGTRLDYLSSGLVFLVDTGNIIIFAVFAGSQPNIPSGNGLLCNIFFTTFDSAANHNLNIDSTHWVKDALTTLRTQFSDSVASNIFPQFVSGKIAVGAAPPNSDSVWVDSVATSPGQKVAVNVYGYNEDDLVQLRLALGYSSSNLIFDTVIFDNTRGLSASSRVVNTSFQNRQILIDLSYTLGNPLVPGSGPLATILFDVDASAPDELVIIDSASYFGIQGIEFIPSVGDPFAPHFHRGFVEIKASTDITTEESGIIPRDFSLLQNAPNPFNPATIIKFELAHAAAVKLNIYNILGQKVRTLVDRQMPAGIYRITFDGRGDDYQQLASGVYLYRMKAGDFTGSKVMIMVK